MTTKKFHVGDVLTITTGRLLAPTHMDGVYAICEWVSGEEGLFTHQLPRVADEIKTPLLEQFPLLATVDVPEIRTKAELDLFLKAQEHIYGEYLEVAQAPQVHTSIDPISELIDMRGGKGVIVVTAGEEPTNG